MAVEVVMKSEATQSGEVALSQPEEPKAVAEETVKVIEEDTQKKEDVVKEKEGVKNVDNGDASTPPAILKNASFKEESNFLSDLKEFEKKALVELRAKVEEAILANKLLLKEEEKEADAKVGEKEADKPKEETAENATSIEGGENKDEKPVEGGENKDEKPVEGGEKKDEKPVEEGEKKEENTVEVGGKKHENTAEVGENKEESTIEVGEKIDEKSVEEVEKRAENPSEAEAMEEEKPADVTEEKDKKSDACVLEKAPAGEQEAKAHPVAEEEAAESSENAATEKIENPGAGTEEKAAEAGETKEKIEQAVEVDKDISVWGVPLLPSKGDESTDVVLLKFLLAREFKVNEAFEMLRNTLLWRKAFNINSILNEEFDSNLNSVAYMNGVDHDGHPVCYNVYGAFEDEEFYRKTFGTEEMREQFLRWRFQVMEKGIEKLNFKRGGVSSLLQITDLKSTPGPSKKELRLATKKAVALLQDNYPEFVARNIFINVPFWYYAFNAIISPFLTQRTKSKFVFARPSKVTETLLRYIPADEIPTQYGGLKRENDTEFSAGNGEVVEVTVKGGSTVTIEIPLPEAGCTIVWDLIVLGWEVNYKEEFIPTDEGSYTTVIQKSKKMGAQDEAVRNSFRNNESGKIVLTVENINAFRKKKLLYRYKVKPA
ncbi:patellin-4-like [Aristolochia californica]|uniref:patellin-4-like n=1 Tax=Aristolochia californica TaxID=171875 RepID=UPI0035DF6346